MAVITLITLGLDMSQAQDSQTAETTVEQPASEEAGTTTPAGDGSDEPDVIEKGNGRIAIPLSGSGLAVRDHLMRIEPGVTEMPLVEIGFSQTQALTVSHPGPEDAAPAPVERIELFGQSAAEFALDSTQLFTLYPGESRTLNITFEPITPGDKTAGIRFFLEGSTVPYVAILKAQARYPLTSDLGASKPAISMGTVVQKKPGSGQFKLTNLGEPDAPAVNVTAITLDGDNATSFSSSFQPAVLLPGESLDVTFVVDTTDLGFKSATAEVSHDGANEALLINLEANVVKPAAIPVTFITGTVNASIDLQNATSLQFGPDNKLYVSEMDGYIQVFDVTRQGPAQYSANKIETIDLIQKVPNHNDDGTPVSTQKRLVTGIHVVGTADNPVIYAASSDWRQAAGPSGTDSNLDTNSGILHKLYKNGNQWAKIDLVRGLPRSEENHVPNGLVLVGNKIYINIGGHTNEGVPSHNFAQLPEYALSAATLEIDLGMINDTTYDIPTLNGPADQYDPFGGHNGLNQAMLVENGPIQLFATGLRNAYDIVYTESGDFYTWDNGGNTGWGGEPAAGSCLNTTDNGGSRSQDGLHKISRGYYAGHPNPTRGNKANTFGGQSPIQGNARPEECQFKKPGNNGALTLNNPSTNGLDEYTASNFGGAMQNDLIAAAMNKTLFRVQLNEQGTAVTSKSVLASNLGNAPLDLTTQGDLQIFPGTIWVADIYGKKLFVLEPGDYQQ